MATPDKPLEQMTAQERFELGKSRYNEGKISEAIEVWANITRDDSPEAYAQAQLNLGNTYYYSAGRLQKAIDAWSKVLQKDNPEAYAQAQLNLGNTHADRNRIDKAIDAWSKVLQKDNPEAYAQAQLNLGNTHADRNRIDKAIDAWINVQHEDNPEAYAQAQLNLGNAYKNDRNLEKAIDAWINVQHEDNLEAYAQAQSSLRDIYPKNNNEDLKPVITAWKKARQRKDNPEAQAQKQLHLGDAYKNKKYIKKAKEAYCKARDHRYHESTCSLNIIECPEKVHEYLDKLFNDIIKILEQLQIIPKFEPKVAHYSRSSTAFSLLKKDKPSNFRLSTIRGVNDPTEGTVLGNYFQKQNIYENIHTKNIATFISCFTFNHDSLNQFRLYGKENGIEATGVSLVFEKDFFDNQYSHLGFIAHLPFINSYPTTEKPDTPSEPEDRQDKPEIEKVSLYRCIYLDPETGHLTLSHRDESTFHLQYKKDKDKIEAEEQWKEYSEKILEIEESAKDHLPKIRDSIQDVLKTILEEKYSDNQEEKILKTVRFILLPLQYLVKHIAFQEEQECRIMYITHLRDEKIRHDWEEQQMYVEYEEPVLPHIDKIYLSPGAAKYQDFFRILLDQKEGDGLDRKENDDKSKVRISQNPFRNKG